MLGVVIVSYRSEKYIQVCLQSLFFQKIPLKCFLVDNASSDETISFVKKYFPEVDILLQKSNIGFSKAVNVGIRKCLENDYEKILILNPDTKMEDGALPNMLEVFDKDENTKSTRSDMKVVDNRSKNKIGIVQPLLTLMSDPSLINTWGNEYMFFGFVGLGGFRRKTKNIKLNTQKKGDQIQFSSGACMLVKSEVFRELGLFDERFFLYFEDTEFSHRVRNAGYRIVLAVDAIVQHDYSILRSFRLLVYFLSSWWKWIYFFPLYLIFFQ